MQKNNKNFKFIDELTQKEGQQIVPKNIWGSKLAKLFIKTKNKIWHIYKNKKII
jgi:hypothetical protein